MKNPLLIVLVIVLSQVSYAQNFKFGKVSAEEIQEKYYPLDSTANAAYLLKKRKTYTTVTGSGIVLITEVQVRMKIYNQDGFDWATEKIKIFGGSNGEKVSNIKGYTFDIIDGKIESTKLDKDDIFSEEKSENYIVKTFTMPNIKEGSVLEWSYRIHSPYLNSIDDVVVQYEIPVKRFEARIKLLEYFNFNKRQKGYYSFYAKESVELNSSLDTNDKVIEVFEDNIPALKPEPYVNNMVNYTAALQFEVASLIAHEYGLYEKYATSWEQVVYNIYKNESFGHALKRTKHLKEDMVVLKTGLTSESDKIDAALKYVKEKIKWNGNFGFVPEEGVKKAYSEGAGNIGDINLTLVSVLKGLGLKANPVLVSSRNKGISFFPTIRGLNYVIAVVETEEGKVLLDASEKYSLPNVLPLRALNWRGVVVKDEGKMEFVDLETSVLSKKVMKLSYSIDDEGLVKGFNSVSYQNLASIDYRDENSNLAEDKIISNIEQENDDIEVLAFRLSNIDNLAKPITEMYQFEKEDGVELIGEKMYISPLLFNAIDENPFKLEAREYPIDFGAPWERKSTATIKLPEGYQVEFIPETVGYKITNNIAEFIYSVKDVGGAIQVSSSVKVNKGIVPANYYKEFKSFYNQIVIKNSEKIVLEKVAL